MTPHKLWTSIASKATARSLAVSVSVAQSGSTFQGFAVGAKFTGVKSVLNLSASGVFAYRKTLYPASINIASLLASCCSLPLWLLSSSSTTARTLKPLLVTTKSAIFLSKLPRLAPFLAVSMAPKLTCVKTMYSGAGKASINLQNIPCSLAVAIDLGPKFPFLAFPVFGIFAAITIAAITAITSKKMMIDFTGSSLIFGEQS